MEPIVIKQSVNSNVIYILGAIILCILSFALVFEDFRSSFDNTLIEGIFRNEICYYIIKVFLFVGFGFFGFATLYLMKRARIGENILTIDEKGIIDNSSSLALGFIPWEDIEEVHIKGTASNKFIELALKDEDKYLSNINKIKKAFILVQKKMRHNVVCISLNIAGLDADKAINYVQDVFKKYKKE